MSSAASSNLCRLTHPLLQNLLQSPLCIWPTSWRQSIFWLSYQGCLRSSPQLSRRGWWAPYLHDRMSYHSTFSQCLSYRIGIILRRQRVRRHQAVLLTSPSSSLRHFFQRCPTPSSFQQFCLLCGHNLDSLPCMGSLYWSWRPNRAWIPKKEPSSRHCNHTFHNSCPTCLYSLKCSLCNQHFVVQRSVQQLLCWLRQ